MLKVIITSKDIVNKIEKGIKFSDYQTVYRGSIKISGDDFDPLLFTREKSEMDFNLLRLTYKRGYINIMDFTLSRFYIVLYKILHVVKDVTSSRLRHWRFSDSSTIDGYSTITCSKGIDRAKTYLLSKYFGCWEADFFGGLKIQEFESAWEKVFSYNLAITVNSLKKNLI